LPILAPSTTQARAIEVFKEPDMTTRLSLKSTLLIAAAALVCAGLQAANASDAPKAMQVVQLPTVVVTAKRAAPVVVVQQLPKVVVVGRRTVPDTATAQTRAGAASAAT
jgi:hypothetical protein